MTEDGPPIQSKSDPRRDEFSRLLGALGFSERLANTLSAQNLHALDHMKREKLYLEGGYQTFDDFLDHDPFSPMKADTFRRRWNLLQGEGDETFNLLNSLKVPMEARKLLAGQVEVKDNIITIGGVGTRLDDNTRIVELISLLHKKTVEQNRTIERGKKDVEKLKRRTDEAERRAINVNPDGTETGQALLTAAGALSRLREILTEAPDEEKQALREPIFELLRSNQLELSVALGIATKAEIKAAAMASKNGDGITDEDLDALDV